MLSNGVMRWSCPSGSLPLTVTPGEPEDELKLSLTLTLTPTLTPNPTSHTMLLIVGEDVFLFLFCGAMFDLFRCSFVCSPVLTVCLTVTLIVCRPSEVWILEVTDGGNPAGRVGLDR